MTVVATPASFNNRAGLARAVNEHLADGTEVFVAEMGTYGPGEIADLCRWCPPDVAVITAIGPVHLERFGSEERILEAKSEILGPPTTWCCRWTTPGWRPWPNAPQPRGSGSGGARRSTAAADVCVVRSHEGGTVSAYADRSVLAEDVPVPTGIQPANLACAIAVALVLGVDPTDVGARLGDLPSVDHRLQAVRSGTGVAILDDTYNSNPAGASQALEALGVGLVDNGNRARRVVVTPGMVELGARQSEENRSFGAAIAGVADEVLIVGRTNRRALLAGVTSVPGSTVGVTLVDHRDQAVAWVREHLRPGDAVLYENDLPDHYP